MIDFLLRPWPWWFSGILIGLTVPLLYIAAGKAFGLSTSLQHVGSMCTPDTSISYLRNHNWRSGIWNLVFIGGIMLGAMIASTWLSAEPATFLPADSNSLLGASRLLFGGVLVGFGARYAGGCTSGHAITGLSNLNWPSFVATIFFFIGGLIATWGFGRFIF